MIDRGASMTEREFLAAELAFGLLDGHALVAAEALRAGDAGFAAQVASWEAKASNELLAIDPIAPPAALWERIAGASSDPAQQGNVVPFDGAARESRIEARIARWRAGALVGGAIAASLAVLMVVRDMPPAPDSREVAQAPALATVQVVDSQSNPIATAVFDQAAGTMRVRLDVDADVGVVPEFWVIPADGVPRSLGRQARGSISLTPEQRRLVFSDSAFAVSLEPDDGQASATPRGVVLGAAPIKQI